MRTAAGVLFVVQLAASPGGGTAPIDRPSRAQSVRALDSERPVVSVWYRGSPPGAPRAADLEAIRAAGFAHVTWPSRHTAGEADLFRLATAAGLQAVLQIDGPALDAGAARQPASAVTIRIGAWRPAELGALVWRALAHGARTISFDPGGAGGVPDGRGRPLPWVAAALDVSRQVATHARLVASWQPAAPAAVDATPAGALDAALLTEPRSWILVVTNLSRERARGLVRLPPGVPSALWVDLLSDGMMSMINDPAGPRWQVDLAPAAAYVFVVNK